MDMFNKYKSPLGYQNGENQIDTYGVNHSNFSIRDELAYQILRQQKEGQMINNYNQQGITKDYPQYSTNFWGSSLDNNFGFGNSHISPNIENMQNTLTANIQNQVYNNSTVPDTKSSFAGSINPYAKIKKLLEQNDYTQNQPQSSSSISNPPYVFSNEMRNRLGFLESRGDYHAHNTSGGGIGALGKYQIRRDGLIDAGYINSNNQWLGKNAIHSQDDFFNNPDKQEQVLNDYSKSNYRQLQSKGALNYLGNRIEGIAGIFDITDTGLLAASHREGAGAVNRYLNNLEKHQNNSYCMNYNKITNPELADMFKRIETRLRKFEK